MLRLILLALFTLGCAGAKGSNGGPGAPGKNGADGTDGTMGAMGDPGNMGSMGPLGERGPSGATGDRGATGAKGEPGAMGTPGVSVALAPEPAASNCAAGGVKLSVGADTQYACNGLPGSKGDQGDPGVKGDKGDPGQAASPTMVLDANGATLGRYMGHMSDFGGGDPYILVLTAANVFIPYDTVTGVAMGYPHAGSTNLQFTSTDCTGPAYDIWKGQIVGGAAKTITDLYTVQGQRATRMMGSQLDDTGTVCTPFSGMRDCVLVSHVGAFPAAAATPLAIQ